MSDLKWKDSLVGFPINDLRIRYNNQIKPYIIKYINYRSLIEFFVSNFKIKFFKHSNFSIRFVNQHGHSKIITNDISLNFHLNSANNRKVIIDFIPVFKSCEKNYEVNETEISSKETSNKLSIKEEPLEKENDNYYLLSDLMNSKKDSVFSSKHNSHNDMEIDNESKSSNVEHDNDKDDKDDSYEPAEEKTSEDEISLEEEKSHTEEDEDEFSNSKKTKLSRKENKIQSFQNDINLNDEANIKIELSSEREKQLREKYKFVQDDEKKRRFSRIKGKKELCNSETEKLKLEEWLVNSKILLKKCIKRYNETTTYAIFFDKISDNIRIRIQLYTHKSAKNKKKSKTFTFFKKGIDFNFWSQNTGVLKLARFLVFALKYLFDISGPILLDDF